MTLVAAGAEEAGLYVRLSDGRLARLDPARLDWSSRRVTGQSMGAVLCVGDILRLQLPGEAVRGRLLSRTASTLELATVGGPLRSLGRDQVLETLILFRASDMKRGDRLLLRSRSGNEYEGTFSRLDASGLIDLVLLNGEHLSVREARLDKEEFYVLVSVDLAQLP